MELHWALYMDSYEGSRDENIGWFLDGTLKDKNILIFMVYLVEFNCVNKT